MRRVREYLLAGALAATAALGGPASAATVMLSQSPGAPVTGSWPLGGFFAGQFDLAPYLQDAQGRTFAISTATLAISAYSAPRYGPPTTTTQFVVEGFRLDPSQSPPALVLDATRTTTRTYADNLADGLTLALGAIGGPFVSGRVTDVLHTSETQHLGVTSEPSPLPGPSAALVENLAVTVHDALYGGLDLSLALDAAALQDASLHGLVDFTVSAGTPGGSPCIPELPFSCGPGFPGFPAFPAFPFPDGSAFTLNAVSLTFELQQTGGPPPEPGMGAVPEPQAWALMIAGFGLAGAALRRRRRVQGAAPQRRRHDPHGGRRAEMAL